MTFHFYRLEKNPRQRVLLTHYAPLHFPSGNGFCSVSSTGYSFTVITQCGRLQRSFDPQSDRRCSSGRPQYQGVLTARRPIPDNQSKRIAWRIRATTRGHCEHELHRCAAQVFPSWTSCTNRTVRRILPELPTSLLAFEASIPPSLDELTPIIIHQ